QQNQDRDSTPNSRTSELKLSLRQFYLLWILQQKYKSPNELFVFRLSCLLVAVACMSKERFSKVCPSLYYISSTINTWNDSRKDCLERGADLVIVNSKEEQEFLRKLNRRFWIGLTDAEVEGEWKWVDGSKLNIRLVNYGSTAQKLRGNIKVQCGFFSIFGRIRQ
uniref:C-type lectin domain-containing protein n=1 Tax=Cyprinodon variegatus TaxID=28743 RepID=A0A3Q2E5F8_CYPVA